MIVFDLRCGRDHVFETWFRDSEAFEAQSAAGEIECPVCGDGNVVKALMAPNVVRRSTKAQSGQESPAMRYLHAVHNHIQKTFDDVGRGFPEEARKIHYGEVSKRNIYGQATEEEAEALEEEGVEFAYLPPIPRYDS